MSDRVRNTSTKIRVGITGQPGFIGTHLYNYLGLCADIERVPFSDDYFDDSERLTEFVSRCDTVIHLAAVNRHEDAKILHDTNIELAEKLIRALDAAGNTPHVIFSSSTQEHRDNLYGRSKRIGRELLMDWARRRQAPFAGLIIPNVFGPFSRPFHNTVIATFSQQIVDNKEPVIEIDAELSLIYINDLVALIYRAIKERIRLDEWVVEPSFQAQVSKILARLLYFKKTYLQEGMIPDLSDPFDLCLYNTLRSFLPVHFFPREYKLHADDRGAFVELVKSANGGQTSFSTTHTGIIRGNHFHTRKVERFMVIRGQAEMQLRRIGTEAVITYQLSGDRPSYVDIPVWHTHNIRNTGQDDLYTVFWINEMFNPEDTDTFYEKVVD